MTKIYSGNASDTKVFQERITNLKEQFINSTDLMPEFIVADSKFYNKKNIESCVTSESKWITRVPDSIKEVKEILEKPHKDTKWVEILNTDGKTNIRYTEVIIEKYNVQQRMITVVSDSGLKRAIKTVDRQIKREKESIDKKLKKLSKRVFLCEGDAKKECDIILNDAEYHKLDTINIEEQVNHGKKGRPKSGDKGTNIFHVFATIKTITEEEIEQYKNQKGAFVIGTNDLTTSAEKIISIYKNDQQGVERGFRFLKNPAYFSEAFFLKNPKRIIALLTLMTISLLIYSLLQRKIRQAITDNNEPIPDQKGKSTRKPTMNWVNQCFEGIEFMRYKVEDRIVYSFCRISKFVHQVLRLLGEHYVKKYSIAM